MARAALHVREGTEADLPLTFALSERAIYDTAARASILPAGREPTAAEIRSRWRRQRSLVEWMATQPDGRYWLCEAREGPVAFARVVRLGDTEQLTELMVEPRHQGQGIGRSLMRRCWPDEPQPALTRVVVAAGAPRDLSLYLSFGVLPVGGHWHLIQSGGQYLERRALEPDSDDLGELVLDPARAVEEWSRLEPPALGRARRPLHQFLAGGRSCLALGDPESKSPRSLCWVSGDGQVGPGVAERAEDLVPVVLAALDRVARSAHGAQLSLFVTSTAWPLLGRLRSLGFRVHWPSWVMCSAPLAGLDRYLPTARPTCSDRHADGARLRGWSFWSSSSSSGSRPGSWAPARGPRFCCGSSSASACRGWARSPRCSTAPSATSRGEAVPVVGRW